jgi:chromosome segregation ATPase
MNTFKRILAWAVVVISIIGILACLAGIIGGWVVNERLTNSILNLLSGVQSGLSSVEGSLTRVSDHLSTANSAIDSVRQSAAQLGDQVEANTPVLDAISRTIDERLSPSVNRLRELILPVWERILAINNTLEALNTLPGIQLPTLTAQLQSLDDQIQAAIQGVEELRADIQSFRSGVVENVRARFSGKIDTIATFLSTIEGEVNTYLAQVKNLQAAVSDLQVRIPSTIDTITLLLSILLIWIILAQISLALVAMVYLRTGQMVWEFGPPGKPADEALPEPGQ